MDLDLLVDGRRRRLNGRLSFIEHRRRIMVLLLFIISSLHRLAEKVTNFCKFVGRDVPWRRSRLLAVHGQELMR